MTHTLKWHGALSFLLGIAFTLWGCGATPTPTLNPPYPPQAGTPGPYPVSTVSSLPYPIATATAPKYVLSLDPVHSGDIHVTGSGPTKLPIQIIDVSKAGKQLGVGVINDAGRFDVPINPSAIGGNRIGIMLGDLTGTSYRQEDFTGRDMPLIGLVLTSTMTLK